MKQLLTAILASALLCSCAYMTAGSYRKTTVTTNPTNGVVTMTCVEKTHGRTSAALDANATLASVSVHSGYATNSTGTWSPGINARGVNANQTLTNVPAILNGAAAVLQSAAKLAGGL